MIRVHVVCEGQTEEAFVNELLAPFFIQKGIYLYPSLIGAPRHRGGNVNIDRVYKDVRKHLLSDKNSFCTTFFDYYGLAEDFPGKSESHKKANISEKAQCVCQCLVSWLAKKVDESVMQKFIPYVQMHEFEGLLFSEPARLASGIYKPALVSALQTIRAQFLTPEHINDSFETAPSKRILKLVSDYQKPVYGTLAALDVGLDAMRRECMLFDKWLCLLENLA